MNDQRGRSHHFEGMRSIIHLSDWMDPWPQSSWKISNKNHKLELLRIRFCSFQGNGLSTIRVNVHLEMTRFRDEVGKMSNKPVQELLMIIFFNRYWYLKIHSNLSHEDSRAHSIPETWSLEVIFCVLSWLLNDNNHWERFKCSNSHADHTSGKHKRWSNCGVD